MSDPGLFQRDPHQEAEELLPWYATGQLNEADRVKVEEHLSSCARCRDELTFERRVVHDVRGSAPEVDAGWARLRSRIEAERAAACDVPHATGSFLKVLRQPVVATLAAAQVGFLVLGAGILLSLSRPTYHALGSPPPAPSANVIVIFRADATVGDIRDALRSSGASIVGGPTSADAYLLRVPINRRQQALARLQSDDDVQLAEPIDQSQ